MEPKKRGRKPQWTDAKVEIMCKAIADGKSYKDAFTTARVSKAAFYAHLANDKDFMDRVKIAEREYQEWYDSQLVVSCKRSLIELVQGYEWDETTTEHALNKDGKMVEVRRKVVHKKAAPNPTAIIFALCNRAPEEWSNKHIQEISGKIETETKSNVSLANVPDNLLEQVIDAINGR
ncbi:MAG: hypothetical protein IKK40_09695 [Bacteroidales bacterium]|nr:hypothetical protein [Bacteroidales bacterium]